MVLVILHTASKAGRLAGVTRVSYALGTKEMKYARMLCLKAYLRGLELFAWNTENSAPACMLLKNLPISTICSLEPQ